ncbi:hypothetical protein ElyMa_001169200 [Elysia marginata]|uniref:Uncharacterized protein n=1 Tax=Elysia marginata TaxID=1093978 RepID=A0AAV4I6D0_9GAST|nr:hypothetical protein ElyMa_001169200 [Elysia marginata]
MGSPGMRFRKSRPQDSHKRRGGDRPGFDHTANRHRTVMHQYHRGTSGGWDSFRCSVVGPGLLSLVATDPPLCLEWGVGVFRLAATHVHFEEPIWCLKHVFWTLL